MNTRRAYPTMSADFMIGGSIETKARRNAPSDRPTMSISCQGAESGVTEITFYFNSLSEMLDVVSALSACASAVAYDGEPEAHSGEIRSTLRAVER